MLQGWCVNSSIRDMQDGNQHTCDYNLLAFVHTRANPAYYRTGVGFLQSKLI